jgi:LmbE family N-acetylglucosaminyl deacetylase
MENNRRTFIKNSLAISAGMVALNSPAVMATTSEAKSILAIAAHPGDGMFSMGATVAQQIAKGGIGTFLSLSLGERGHSSIPPEEYGQMQVEAMDTAAHSLGAETAYLDYPDAEIPFNEEASLLVCDEIRRLKPSIILTHWEGSWHKDHRHCYQIVQYAHFYAGLKTLTRDYPAHYAPQLYFAENWEDMEDFQQDTYLDISEVNRQWLSACAHFPMWRGETGFRYNDYYSSLAVMRGCLSGFSHAVALMSGEGQRVRKLKEF